MRISTLWKSGLVALGGATLGLVALSGADAQAPVTLPMTVTENRVPGAGGQVTMTPLGNNQVRVDIRLTGIPANGQHIAHIHTAPGAVCDNNAPVAYPLTTVQADAAGVGTSTTTLTLTADKPINANNAYVNVHQNATPPAGGLGVICGNVTASFVAGAAGAAQPGAQAPAGAATQPAALPRTGTGFQADSASGLAVMSGLVLLVVALGGTSLAAVTRRR